MSEAVIELRGMSAEELADDLKEAIKLGDPDLVKAALRRGADVNHASYSYGLTPLHIAAVHNQLAIVKLLLNEKAKVTAVTTDGCFLTPRAIAEAQGHEEVIREILKVSDGVPSAVNLNIYDVGSSKGGRLANKVFRALGTGAYHAGVEVHGQEFSFGYTTPDRSSGVYICLPRSNPMHTFRESVPMGESPLSEREVDELLKELAVDWPGQGFDLLRRNCCHFANTVCIRLSVGPIPRWVMSLAGTGSQLRRGTQKAISWVDQAWRYLTCCGIRARESSTERLVSNEDSEECLQV